MTKTISEILFDAADEYAEARHLKGSSIYNAEVRDKRAQLAKLLSTAFSFDPQFDAISLDQERLAIEFCLKIAGRRGEPPSPPDPVRILEMAEELYQAELQYHLENGNTPPAVSNLAVWAEEALWMLDRATPSKGCGCHTSPPCNDCVEHEDNREIIENLREALKAVQS